VPEIELAVGEGRVLRVDYWSNFGEGEACFGFATSFGLDGNGHVHPTCLVFPRPISIELRRQSDSNWEEIEDVFAAFGVYRRG
jgi:hypothetical protein